MRLIQWIKVSMMVLAVSMAPAMMTGCEEKKGTAESAGAAMDKAASDAAKKLDEATKK
jgi:hypothetical protein